MRHHGNEHVSIELGIILKKHLSTRSKVFGYFPICLRVTVHSPLSGTAFRSTWSQPCVRL